MRHWERNDSVRGFIGTEVPEFVTLLFIAGLILKILFS